MDFSGGTGQVRAARDGIAYYSASCPNYISIVHGGGWKTTYYHAINIAVGYGQSVSRGQFLGNISAQAGCGGSATGPHVHFATYFNNVAKAVHGLDIGGWTVENGSAAYTGCMVRISDGSRQCSSQGQIYNGGSTGSGSPANQPPNKPTLVAPADGTALGSSTSVTLEWKDNGDPDNKPNDYRDYYIEIYRDSTLFNQKGWVKDTSWTISNLSTGNYDWRVKSGDGAVDSGWVGPWHFTVGDVPPEVICDNQSACFSKYESSGVGSWGYVQPGTGDSSAAYSQHAYWTYNSLNSALDWGKWQPNLPQAGTYNVYVWYPHYPGSAPETNSASYQVHHANGDTNVTWNQATNPGVWNKLATVNCAAGTACYVKLTDSTPEGTGTRRVWFDAVKFVQEVPATLPYTLSGRVTTTGSVGIAGVTLTDGTRSTTTGSDGSFTLSGVPAGTYTLTPTKSGYTFVPVTRSVTVSGNLSGQDFTGTPVDTGTSLIIKAISPREGSGSQPTSVTISGSGFTTSPAPTAQLSGAAGSIALTNVSASSATSFTATVPANLAPGSYDLIVTSNGHTSTLPNAFTVLAVGLQVSQVAPTSGLNDRTTDLLVQGLNFADGAVVALGNTILNTTRVNVTTLLAVVPVGLTPATYDLTVTNLDASHAQLATAYTVLDATSTLNNDLLSTNDQLWLNPVTPRVNTPVQLGLILQRSGGKAALEGVTVEFRRDAVDGPLLGTSSVPFLDPRASSESTTPINVTFPSAGTVTIFAIIDPQDIVAEGNEANNVVSRTVVVAASTTDLTIPAVQGISINGGSNTTVTEQDVTVGIEATDPAPNSSGVQAVHLIEYVYSQAAQRWIAVTQSGWLPYSQSPASYGWSLLPLSGMHYVQVRARDAANNVSIGNARQLVNYESSADRIGQNQTRIYRYNVAAGQVFSVNLEVLSGDADLYVWSSRIDQSARVSNQEGSASEQVVIPASEVVPGVYQVEVYGYSAAEYRLSTSNGATLASLQAVVGGGLDASKTVPSAPVVPVASIPDERTGSVPPVEPASGYRVYLPLTVR
ncbi:DUF2012 domain-containing protein [Chloroflexales bacterium ZM16-3]|nr:DUF2012 domain-containing protein [Chloroflexales bacterium ZM16-3]